MKRKIIPVVLVVMMIALVVSLASSCHTERVRATKVITGTSLIGFVTKEIGGERVEVSNLVPPGQCPGHYDIKPSDVQMLAEGDLFLIHDWQQNLSNIKKLLNSAKNPNLEVKVIAVKGNWMAPPVQAEAVKKIAEALAEVDPENKSYYLENASKIKVEILAKGEELKKKLEAEKAGEVKVLVSQYQLGFVKWAGFNVVASYPPRPEALTPKKIRELVDLGKKEGVALVVDNLQSGPKAGLQMAEEIGATHIILSNFPGGFEGTETWSKAVEENVNRLIEGIKEYQRKKS